MKIPIGGKLGRATRALTRMRLDRAGVTGVELMI
jgi:hypothetical protein